MISTYLVETLFIISISLVPTICEIFSFISAISVFGNVLTVAHIARKNISKLCPCTVCWVTNGVADTAGLHRITSDLFTFSYVDSSMVANSSSLGCFTDVET